MLRQHVGLAIKSHQLEAQIEGSLIWGLGMALVERVEIGASGVASLNFDRYPIPRMTDTPRVASGRRGRDRADRHRERAP